MSQENVELSQRALDAGNRRDKAAWLELNDPEVEWVPARDWPESDAIRGREAVWDFYVEVNEPWEEGAFEYVEVIEAGDDKLVTHARAETQGKASGAPVVLSYWLVITFRNGKILRIEWFLDRGEALEAVGLRE
jgi:ketosteroid isomerase-like protein